MGGVLDTLEGIANVMVQGSNDLQVVHYLATALLHRLDFDESNDSERHPDDYGKQFTGVFGRGALNDGIGCEGNDPGQKRNGIDEQCTT